MIEAITRVVPKVATFGKWPTFQLKKSWPLLVQHLYSEKNIVVRISKDLFFSRKIADTQLWVLKKEFSTEFRLLRRIIFPVRDYIFES